MELKDFSVEQLANIMTANAVLFGVGFAALLVWFTHRYRFAISLRLIRLRHNFPLIGKIARTCKNDNVSDGWFLSEIEVAQDYKNHYQQIRGDLDHYNNCVSYLAIAGETGRKPVSFGLLFILFIVLCVEAWGFTYTMAGFVDISASENTRQVIATIMSITFAVVLATVTHKMGHEMHRNTILGNIHQHWQNDDLKQEKLLQNIGANLCGIDNPTDVDDKSYQRRLNRLKLGSNQKSYKWTIATITVITAIASILTFIRVKALETNQFAFSNCGTTSVNIDALYGEVSNTTAKTCEATIQGSWATFAAMALLFCLLQVFTTWIAKSRGFASAQGAQAYDFIKGYNNRKHYCETVQYRKEVVCDMAQYSLSKLQQRMAKKLSSTNSQAQVMQLLTSANNRSFKAFLARSTVDLLDNPIFEGAKLEDIASEHELMEIENILNKRLGEFLNARELETQAERIRAKRDLLRDVDYRYSYQEALNREFELTGKKHDLYSSPLKTQIAEQDISEPLSQPNWRTAVAKALTK